MEWALDAYADADRAQADPLDRAVTDLTERGVRKKLNRQNDHLMPKRFTRQKREFSLRKPLKW
ncbi:hypothetical protein LSP04_08690 [Levilactobacillus spicheri]|uniref:Transposase n=1 Tax=Levilactobacillus spicheri TaxID=216463 RepID=A0ABQ0WPF4_9LACO|nr:hypothetical protein LSP04_08690 [Levilactobacillus spicheri]